MAMEVATVTPDGIRGTGVFAVAMPPVLTRAATIGRPGRRSSAATTT
jgi:hypothetical protein